MRRQSMEPGQGRRSAASNDRNTSVHTTCPSQVLIRLFGGAAKRYECVRERSDHNDTMARGTVRDGRLNSMSALGPEMLYDIQLQFQLVILVAACQQ